MRATSLFAFLVGLSSFGCMTDAELSKQADEDVATRISDLTSTGQDRTTNVPTGVRCSDKDWQITFWAEPQMITLSAT